MTRFFDANIRPPRGGWNYPINGELVVGMSESEIVEKVIRWERNNGSFVSDAHTRDTLWEYWCQREPSRCGLAKSAELVINVADVTPIKQLVPAEKTPELQGPPIWLFLNTLAAQWNPGLHSYFLATCDALVVILECPICRDEWRKQLQTTPPAGLSTRLQVCQWVNAVHNSVNARKGKAQYSYAQMIVKFGAPVP